MRAPLVPGLLLLLAMAGPAAAEAAEVRAAYRVAWIGLPVAAGTVEARTGSDRYSVSYDFETIGFLGLLFSARTMVEAEGTLDRGRPTPERFVADGRWRGRDHRSALDFRPDGSLAGMQVDADDADREPVPAALRRGPDPLSLAVEAALGAAAGRTLDGESFDGRRATRADLRCGGLAAVPGGDGRPATEALRCELTARLVAGASRRYRARGMKLDGPVVVWLEPGIVPDAVWPIRVEASTSYGAVVATLQSLRVSPGPAPRPATD